MIPVYTNKSWRLFLLLLCLKAAGYGQTVIDFNDLPGASGGGPVNLPNPYTHVEDGESWIISVTGGDDTRNIISFPPFPDIAITLGFQGTNPPSPPYSSSASLARQDGSEFYLQSIALSSAFANIQAPLPVEITGWKDGVQVYGPETVILTILPSSWAPSGWSDLDEFRILDPRSPTQLYFDIDEFTIFSPVSIATGAIAASTFCAGASINVPFTSAGTFNSGNTYTVELSDPTGSFVNPVNIGSLNATGNSGTISATIPFDAAEGTGYRVRVVSSNLVSFGSDNGADLTILSNSAITSVTSNQNNLCPNTPVELTANGATAGTGATLTWFDGPTGTGNNLGNSNPLTITPTGTTTYYARLAGTCNTVEQSVTVNVGDIADPVAVTQNITVQLDASGNASITPAQIDNGSSDNCSAPALSLDQNTFSCAHIGNNTVTLTATDPTGNSATATATVTIEDNIPPIVTCPQDITSANLIVSYELPQATDNCSIEAIQLVSGFASGEAFPEGTTIVTYDIRDNAGNTTSCSFNITVGVQNSPPTDILLSNTTITDDTEESQIGVFSTTDADAGDAHTYSLVSGDGDSDNSFFTIQNDNLFLSDLAAGQLNDISTLSIRVRSTDQAGAFIEKSIPLRVMLPEPINDLRIPTAFTPNNDGENDTWNISNITQYPQVRVTIFSSNGHEIFSSNGYEREWDGTYRGDKLPMGTYYYVIRLNDNQDRTFKGFVTILQ